MTSEQKRLENLLLTHLENRVGSVSDVDFLDIPKTAIALIDLWKCAETNEISNCVLRVLEENNAFEHDGKITIYIDRN